MASSFLLQWTFSRDHFDYSGHTNYSLNLKLLSTFMSRLPIPFRRLCRADYNNLIIFTVAGWQKLPCFSFFICRQDQQCNLAAKCVFRTKYKNFWSVQASFHSGKYNDRESVFFQYSSHIQRFTPKAIQHQKVSPLKWKFSIFILLKKSHCLVTKSKDVTIQMKALDKNILTNYFFIFLAILFFGLIREIWQWCVIPIFGGYSNGECNCVSEPHQKLFMWRYSASPWVGPIKWIY